MHSGTYVYRLTLHDLDGTTHLSGVLTVNYAPAPTLTLYPNPVRDQLTIVYSNQNVTDFRVQVRDINGKRVYESSLVKNGSRIDVSTWPSGWYALRIFSDAFTETRTFWVE